MEKMGEKKKKKKKNKIKETNSYHDIFPSLEIFIGEQYSVKVEMKIP